MTKTEQQVNCTTCTWNKQCIEPPTMTREEIEAKIDGEKLLPEPDSLASAEEREEWEKNSNKSLIGGLMSVMMFSGRDTECRVCPVLAEKLREGPAIPAIIKEYMKSL